MDNRRPLTIKEITDIIESEEFWDEKVSNIYISPPEGDISEEDSADEDGGGLVDNLSGRQLQAQAEIVFSNGRRASTTEEISEIANEVEVGNSVEENDSDESEDNLPLNSFISKKSVPITNKHKFLWSKSDINVNQNIFSEANYSHLRNITSVDAFEKIFDDEIFEFLADQSNLYAAFKNCNISPSITANEIRCFIAILFVSGYNKLPSKRSFWDSKEDMRNEMVYKAMRRDRFDLIMRYMHCSDNNKLDKTDKMAKVRPFMDLLKLRFKNHFIPEREIDYDESMIEYYGRHGCKQFIRGKPIRFGYKAWCINTKSGYLVNFDIYQGTMPGIPENDKKLYGKATAPLLKFIEELTPEIKALPFRFYFDNLFTSMAILIHLKTLGYGATGTMRENRVPKNCPIKSVKEMKKLKRGTFEYASTNVNNTSVVITRWMDNSVVTVGSTCHGVFPITTAKRYSAADKKHISIERPRNISIYNKFMGGTDQMDANLGVYRIGVRGKKWWWPIFTWLVDVSVQNAWSLKRAGGNDISQLEFRRQIVQYYLTRYAMLPKHGGRPQCSGSTLTKVLPEIQFDRTDHFIEYVPGGKRRRCASETHKGSAVRTQCQKCGLGLCIDCFAGFHRKY